MRATLPQTTITSSRTSASSLTSGGSGQGGSNTNSQLGRSSVAAEAVPYRGALQILEELGANGSTTAKSPLLRGMQVTADSRTNTLTLVGTPDLIQVATEYLGRLDVRRKQVSINVKIVEVDLTKGSNIGSSFSFGVSDNFFSTNQGVGTVNIGQFNPSLADPNSLTSPPTIANPLGGVLPSAIGIPPLFQFPTQLLLRLQAQVTSGNAKILTDPTLIVQEGSQSQVNLTSQVFAGFNEQRVVEGNIATTRVLPLPPIDVGVILNIDVEQIDDNDFITLSVSPEVSSPGQQITDPSRNNLLIQQLVNRRRLETGRMRLRNGQTLILTGIIQQVDRTITTKTPILGDIPLLNLFFRNRRTQSDRNEVIVLVTPQILNDSDRLPPISSPGYTPTPEAQKLIQRRQL
jgi:type IV pilus assembly protein PilQ